MRKIIQRPQNLFIFTPETALLVESKLIICMDVITGWKSTLKTLFIRTILFQYTQGPYVTIQSFRSTRYLYTIGSQG